MRYITFIFLAFVTNTMLFGQIQNKPTFIFEGSEPSFSPDGRYIACEHNKRIWIIDLKTNEKKQVSTLSWDFRPRWNPNGDKIIFQSYGDTIDFKKKHRFSIWIVNIDGSNQHKFIEEIDRGDQTPYWSPDGNWIAWTHGKRIWIANANGKGARPLTKEPAIEYEHILDWSKNSRTVLYVGVNSHRVGVGPFISLVDTNSQNQIKLDTLREVDYAKFDKDGISVYFTTRFDHHLSKYYFVTKKILQDLIKIDNNNEARNIDFSSNYNFITFDNSAPETEPNIYIMKIK